MEHESGQELRQKWLKVVAKNGLALRYAPECVKADLDVVLEALREDGRALPHVAEKLKLEQQVVLTALRQNLTAWRYANEQVLDSCLVC